MHVLVVGGGIGGLATALALGRQGHRVTVVDRDGLAPDADVDAAFASERRGAPQTRHTHGFLARLVRELRARFPDVHEELVAAGAVPLPLTRAFDDPRPGDEELVVLTMRRSTVEWVLRRRAAESSVALRSDVGVTGLRAKPADASTPLGRRLAGAAGGPPTVTGVELDDGTALDADVVVLATGRRSPVPAWLADVGVDIDEEVHESGLVYLSRWYRRPGGFAVDGEAKAGGDHGFLKYLAIPGDGDVASITLALRTRDTEMRALLSAPDRFDAAAGMYEGARALFAQGDVEPVTGVLPMGGLINRRRRFLAPGGTPVVLGLHVVGDAHTCTNPLYGRGCSLAVVQAGLLADTLLVHPGTTAADADARARSYEGGCVREVEPWFEISVQADAMGADPNGASIAASGSTSTAASAAHDANKAIARVFAAGGRDPIVGRGLMRLMNLLATPSDLMADPEFVARSMEILGDPETYPVPPPPAGPNRRELLEALSAQEARHARPRHPQRTHRRREGRRQGDGVMGDPRNRIVTRPDGVELHVTESGPDDGPLVVLAHGFPELAYSWRHQVPALAAAGYHVLAPDQRGYGRSTQPAEVEAYDIAHLTDDIVALIDDAGADTAAIVGHDWGSIVVWGTAQRHPDRVAGVVGMSVPFVPRGSHPPTSAMRHLLGDAFFYMLYFQEPGVADADLDADPERTLRGMLLGLSPAAQETADPAAMFANDGRGFVERLPQVDELPGWITEDEVQHYVSEFRRTGFTGGISWYRNLDRNWELMEPFVGQKVAPPARFVGGALDPVLLMTPPSVQDGWLADDRGTVIVPEASHWVQQERPAEVNRALFEFLAGLDPW